MKKVFVNIGVILGLILLVLIIWSILGSFRSDGLRAENESQEVEFQEAFNDEDQKLRAEAQRFQADAEALSLQADVEAEKLRAVARRIKADAEDESVGETEGEFEARMEAERIEADAEAQRFLDEMHARNIETLERNVRKAHYAYETRLIPQMNREINAGKIPSPREARYVILVCTNTLLELRKIKRNLNKTDEWDEYMQSTSGKEIYQKLLECIEYAETVKECYQSYLD